MKKSTKSLLLAALVSLVPAACVQAQLTDGVPETDTSLITGSTFNVDATTFVPTDFMGDTTGATISQINVLNGGDLSATNNNFDFTEINIESGGDTTNSVTVNNAELNVLPGGALGSGLTVGANSTLNVGSGVTDIGNNFTIAGTANINSGTHTIAFESLSGSTVNIGGTTQILGNSNDFAGTVNIGGTAEISSTSDFTSTSNVTITGGTIGNQADFDGGLNISGGNFGTNVNINSTATDGSGGNVVISGGTFGPSGGTSTLEIFAPTTVTGGNFNNSVDFEIGSAGSVINSGTFGNNTDFLDDITINGGTFGTNQDIGNFSDTSALNDNPNVTINGGTFTELDVDSGVTDIFGGTFIGGGTGVALAAGATRDNDTLGTINIHGGDIQGLIEGFGNINLFGTDFAIDGTPLAGLDSIDVDGFGAIAPVLTGTLEDGNTISLNLDGGFNFVNPDTGIQTDSADINEGTDLFGLFGVDGNTGGILTAGGTIINVVPEPSSLSLLALGAFGLITRRRRS